MTLADELHYVEKYLRLEQARFGDRLEVRGERRAGGADRGRAGAVDAAAGGERGAPRRRVRAGPCRVEILGADLDADVELTVKDGGAGMTAEEAAAALEGRGAGIGLANVARAAAVDVRRRSTGWRWSPRPERERWWNARAEVPRGGARRVTLRILAVDDERPALDDLARVLRAQPDGGGGGARRRPARRRCTRSPASTTTRSSSTCACPAWTASSWRACCGASPSPPALIFVSAYESAAVEAFELRALDYLLKPVVAGAGGRGARARRAERRPTTRRTRSRSTCPAAARAWCGATTSSTCRPTATTCAWSPPTAASSCAARSGEIERRWEPHGFHRVHRRFLVNLRRAAEVRPQLNGTALLILADGAELPIARREVAELRRRLRS